MYNIYIVYKSNKNTCILDQIVFQWAPSDVYALVADVECSDFSSLFLMYLHG